jgi:PAS domain S-box-containing protein
MKTRQPLLVPDALRDEEWSSNPDIKLGMISYLGLPISWPDGEIFGTICVLDNKRNEYGELYRKLLLQWRDVLQADLRSIATLQGELEEREAKIRRLVDANIIGVLISDLEGQLIEANDAFLDMVGYTRDDVASGRLRWTEITPTEWQAASERAVAQLRATGACEVFEKEYFRKDGSRVPVLVGAAAVGRTQSEGIAFVLDQTERKRAEEALRQSEERFRTLVQFSFDVYWESDAEHRFIRQEFAEGLVDAPAPGSEIGKTRWEVPYLEPDAEAWRKHRETLDAHLPFRDFEFARPTPDGGKRYVSVSGLPVFDAAGRFVGYRGVGRHITERKRAEESLRKMQMELAHVNRVATIGQLTASIAHEVRQPIGAAVTNAQAALHWLGRQPLDLEEVRRALGRIVETGHRASDVVDRIRALIKKAPPRRDCLDINEAVRDVIELTRGEAVKNGVLVWTDLADGLPLIEGDRVQLQQVILNLTINAVEAMSGADNGTRELLISTRKVEPGGVLVVVRDSGPGLAPAALKHLFDAFYTTKPGGLGLGLSICRSIIEGHGGRLWATANVPRGAAFEFTVPADAGGTS